MAGKLYGLGIGPGDPELLTLKAVRLIKESDVVFVPGTDPKDTVAYQITVQAVPELEDKEIVGIAMPMTKNLELLEETHEKGANEVAEYLKDGKQCVFLTLGDPTVYSTYMYIHKKIQKLGYETEIVSGIPSFCAVAAKMGISLSEKAEELHVIPAVYQIEEGMELKGTKVFMKVGKRSGRLRELLKEKKADAVMIENCGMPGEKIFSKAEDFPDMAGYYSLVIAKEGE